MASYWVWLVWSWSMRSAMPRNTWASGEMWLANARPPRPWDGSGPDPVIGQPECVQLQEGGLSLDGCWAPGADRPAHGLGRHPGNAKSSRPSADALARPSEDGGPSVGHGYKNDKGQGIVTPPYRPPMLHAVRTGKGP